MSDELEPTRNDSEPETLASTDPGRGSELELLSGGRHAKYRRFVLAALGSIPWVGGLLGAISGLDAEKAQERLNSLHHQWIQEHHERLQELGAAISEITGRLESIGGADERVQSDEYLGLVRYGFRTWDHAATSEKRKLVQQLLSNAGGTRLVSDDVVRLFIEWIDKYHEAHFAVIREIHRRPGITRFDIWQSIRGSHPRESSAEADLFKLLIRDLSTGSVIRQHRETDYAGNFLPKKKSSRKGAPKKMKSAFDDSEQYELTELGKQFVHYAMTDLVPRIGG
ncbi:MAG: hypothetical protein KC416_02360 [Myxococcales bacterium]|nr:hypothetical protein [Myxococcales bacterium]